MLSWLGKYAEQQAEFLQRHQNCSDVPLLFSFERWNRNETRTFYQRNLNQIVARLRSAVTPVKGTGRLLYIVCCWFPISVYRYHVLLFAVTIHWTATEHPRWEEQQTHQIEMASGDHSGSITYSFKCGLRGLHVYKEVWSPIVGEQLKCCYERNNCYDRYAITVTKCLRCRLGNSTVGHLPREISRATRSGRSGLFVLKSSTRTTEDLP